jgi:O-acetyl-ADP-ribose deacetylase (regulator of RNase III)
MAGLITLSRAPVQVARTEVIAYGAKDSGDMGGVTARDILMAAGAPLLDAINAELGKSGRQVGDVAVTESFGLQSRGIQWICHIIAIIKNTPRGTCCPDPKRLADGVSTALERTRTLGAHSITLSALGSGEGQVPPAENARLMLGAAKDFLAKNRDYLLDIEFALTDYRDYDAFEKLRSGRG